MTSPIDWKALFGAYMDYVWAREGTDYLWPHEDDSAVGVAVFKKMLTTEQYAEFTAFVAERRAAQDERHRAWIERRRK